ncbi:hypothetical protein G6F36_011646 [Rhizopus arrhizus]|nr:hypothetical protein G6F36_011646 [Rhizopus arrhizus]
MTTRFYYEDSQDRIVDEQGNNAMDWDEEVTPFHLKTLARIRECCEKQGAPEQYDVRAERGDDVIIVLVGNKSDLSDKREVTTDDGEKRAKELNVMFIETSAKAGHNVKTLFKKIAQSLPGVDGSAIQSDSKDSMQKVNLNNTESNTSSCAC